MNFYSIKSKLLEFLGNIQWFGWNRPFWFVFGAKGYDLKGEHYRLVEPLLQPGDILLQRFEGWVDKWFIPGFWNHAAIYIGGDKKQVVHAVSEGVLIEDIINFMRTDHLIILRAKPELANNSVKLAKSIIGAKYDFDFDFNNHDNFSCTEVIDFCFPELLTGKIRFGQPTIAPDDIASCYGLETIWDSRKFNVSYGLQKSSVKYRAMERCVS